MSRWKDIYEISGRIFKDILCTAEEDVTEKMTDERAVRFMSESSLTDRLKCQEKYDAHVAYRRLQVYRRRLKIRRYSAVAGILLVAALAVGLLLERRVEPSVLSVVNSSIQPGGKKAILTLANGAVMNVRDSSLTSRDIGRFLNSDSIQSELTSGVATTKTGYHTLFVPRGGEFFLILPDSTKVWLNSETELRFPAQFADDSRSVILKGEAFFEVAHEESRPFRVRLKEGMITVFGTQFCVSAYEESDLVATLSEGSIGFRSSQGQDVRLKPSQQLIYSPETEKMIVREVNTRIYTSWKDHLFSFEEQSLEEIMNILSRWYDVDIFFENPQLKQLKMSGTIDKYEEIGPLLKLFEAGQNVRFDVNERTIIIRQMR